MTITKLHHPDAMIQIEPSSQGNSRTVRVELNDSTIFSPRKTCQTTYSDELLQLVLDIKGPAYLCDEIARDEDPSYVADRLKRTLLGYFSEQSLNGKRMLDFGCGSGASTMILARLFPQAQIVGIELNDRLLDLARARAKHYGFENIRLILSPSGTQLPDDLGQFDLIMMNAVYEHMLPDERKLLMPQIWKHVEPGGALFIDETPNRIYHVERHTTGLPLINYLPDRLAHAVVRRFSYRLNDETWPRLLREGVRGGTEREILKLLRDDPQGKPRILEPTQSGMRDRIDLQFALYMHSGRMTPKKKFGRIVMKLIKGVTGITYLPVLSIMVQKPALADVSGVKESA